MLPNIQKPNKYETDMSGTFTDEEVEANFKKLKNK